MTRSYEQSGTPGSNSFIYNTSSLPRRRSRPEVIDHQLHDELVDFLSNPLGPLTPTTPGGGDNVNMFSGLRRSSAGRRSFRTMRNIAEDMRERQHQQRDEEMDAVAEEPTTPFNRFTHLRRTLNYKNSKGEIATGGRLGTIPSITINHPEGAQSQPTTASVVGEESQTKSEKSTTPPGGKKKSYIQHLTAIISPTKVVDSNDAVHREFGKNLIISTVVSGERPNGHLPPIQAPPKPLTNSATAVNAAIVVPIQRVTPTDHAGNTIKGRGALLAPLSRGSLSEDKQVVGEPYEPKLTRPNKLPSINSIEAFSNNSPPLSGRRSTMSNLTSETDYIQSMPSTPTATSFSSSIPKAYLKSSMEVKPLLRNGGAVVSNDDNKQHSSQPT